MHYNLKCNDEYFLISTNHCIAKVSYLFVLSKYLFTFKIIFSQIDYLFFIYLKVIISFMLIIINQSKILLDKIIT
jgi:hypothetical protein